MILTSPSACPFALLDCKRRLAIEHLAIGAPRRRWAALAAASNDGLRRPAGHSSEPCFGHYKSALATGTDRCEHSRSGLALVAVGAGVGGLLWAAPGRDGASVASLTPRAGATETAVKRPARPTPPARPAHVLHGAAPDFSPPPTRLAAKVAGEKALGRGAVGKSTKAPSASISSAPTITGKPAGPAAIKVARTFSDAFVLYEIGQGSAHVRSTFTNTASPALARSLLGRPPRQPDQVRVPKAKVLNIVAGPSSGSVYTISVSLLRVGLTSELQLEMEKTKRGDWHVTNVLG